MEAVRRQKARGGDFAGVADDESYGQAASTPSLPAPPQGRGTLAYDTEKIDFFVGLAFVMALALEGKIAAFLHHKGVAVAFEVLAAVELLITCGYYIVSLAVERPPYFYRRLYTILQAPIMMTLFGFIVWSAVDISRDP